MSIKATLSSDGLEEVYTAPTLKEMCLYKCLTKKEILTKEIKVDGKYSNRREKFDWETFRLKETVQKDLVEALLDAGEKYMFTMTPNYQPVLAAIRMSQPEHLVKVHVNNTDSLDDRQLEFLISGGNVKSMDINGCKSLGKGSLYGINKFGNKLEYLRIGNSSRQVLPSLSKWNGNSPILRTPNLKTFIVSGIYINPDRTTNYWRFLLQDFINNLEHLHISDSGDFETLEFLKPARSKLSSLSLRECVLLETRDAWEFLFKLDKLRFLDVANSWMGATQNVVQRLLIAMPNLTHLTVSSGSVNRYVETSRLGQGSVAAVAKRLELLGIMDNEEDNVDEDELRTAKLLADDVAYSGTVEGELRMLEYYSIQSNRLNVSHWDNTLKDLFQSLNMMTPFKTVAVTSLLLSTVKNNGVTPFDKLIFQHLKNLFTPDVAAKLGVVLQDQCIEIISACGSQCFEEYIADKPLMISDVMDILMNLEERLRFDHYETFVSMAMRMVIVGTVKKSSRWDDKGTEGIRDFLRKVAQFLEKAGDRFPEETDALWGISSVLVVAKELKNVIASEKLNRVHLMGIFGSIIPSLENLCLKFNSSFHRASFHLTITIVEWLTDIIDGCLGLADRDSFALIEFLKGILQDTELDATKTWVLSSRLEKLLLCIHSKWELGKSDPLSGTTHYDQLKGIARLLNILQSDPAYKATGKVKKIIVKLK